MGKHCSAFDCKTRWTKENKAHFFTFPSLKNKKVRKKWLLACKFKPTFKPTRYTILCQKHFVETDFRSDKSRRGTPRKKIILKDDAVPSIFAHSSKKETPTKSRPPPRLRASPSPPHASDPCDLQPIDIITCDLGSEITDVKKEPKKGQNASCNLQPMDSFMVKDNVPGDTASDLASETSGIMDAADGTDKRQAVIVPPAVNKSPAVNKTQVVNMTKAGLLQGRGPLLVYLIPVTTPTATMTTPTSTMTTAVNMTPAVHMTRAAPDSTVPFFHNYAKEHIVSKTKSPKSPTYIRLRKKVRLLQQEVRRKTARIKHLTDTIEEMKEKQMKMEHMLQQPDKGKKKQVKQVKQVKKEPEEKPEERPEEKPQEKPQEKPEEKPKEKLEEKPEEKLEEEPEEKLEEEHCSDLMDDEFFIVLKNEFDSSTVI